QQNLCQGIRLHNRHGTHTSKAFWKIHLNHRRTQEIRNHSCERESCTLDFLIVGVKATNQNTALSGRLESSLTGRRRAAKVETLEVHRDGFGTRIVDRDGGCTIKKLVDERGGSDGVRRALSYYSWSWTADIDGIPGFIAKPLVYAEFVEECAKLWKERSNDPGVVVLYER
ncbi:MAG: hypothetical protein Q9186_004347, partial [Xanthomendoza sp. 1 TL-2023]